MRSEDLDQLLRLREAAPDEIMWIVDDPHADDNAAAFYFVAHALVPVLVAENKELQSDYAGLEALDQEASEGARELYAERDRLKEENAQLRASLHTHSCILEAIVNMHPELEDFIEARVWGDSGAALGREAGGEQDGN